MLIKKISILVCLILAAVFLCSGCNAADNRPAYERISDEGRAVVDRVVENARNWERSSINAVYFEDKGYQSCFVVKDTEKASGSITIYEFFKYSLDAVELIDSYEEVWNYSFVDTDSGQKLRKKSYDITWSPEEKKEYLAEKYIEAFEKQD